MDFGLTHKYALVTGGSHGIGLATALELATAGCHVAICSRNPERLAQARKLIERKSVMVLALTGDALVPSDIDRVVEQVIAAWGTMHVLVNNVGGGGRWGKPSVEETAPEVWAEVYQKNAMAAVQFTRLALPYMRRQKWGRVVTISSIYGKEGGGRPWFNMAKAAEISLMKSLAMNPELARDGITFNSVAPGSIMIPNTGWEEEREKNPEAFERMLKEKYPLGRLGTPEEVAAVVAFVCSDRVSLLNGACIVVDGGESRSF